MPHTFFPHQTEALTRITGEPRPALFMQMRLGKTPVIIRWAVNSTEPGRRILVVAPMPTLDDWVEELKEEGVPPSQIVRLDGRPTAQRLTYAEEGTGWYLINYEGVRITTALADLPWDAVIADESTYIRNPQAKVTKALVRQYQHIPLRAVLSGDPAPESALDYFSQFQFLLGHFLSSNNYWAFRASHYAQNPRLTWDWRPRPGTRDKIKEFVHSHSVVMTRQQWGIGGREVYERRVVEQNAAQRAALKQLFTDFQYEYIETNYATVRDIWMARVAGGFSPDRENPELLSNAKTDEIVSLLKGELRKESVVVWFRFNEELEHVVRELNKKKIDTVGITGRTAKVERPRLRRLFNAGAYQVICVQVRLGRMGWNLSRAATAIYYSNAYDWEFRNQSKDRIVHPTKKRDTLIIDLITRGTLDEEVVHLLREKKMNSTAFMRELNRSVWERYWRDHADKTKEKTDSRTGHPGRKEKAKDPTGRVRRVYPGTDR